MLPKIDKTYPPLLPKATPVESMTPAQLIETRDIITKMLPDLTTIDLSSELVGTYLKLKELLDDNLEDLTDTAPNKLASLINSINACLKQLTEFQKELYGVGRQRAFENAIAKTFDNTDEKLRQTFLDILEQELEQV